jgi:hypothetical protein
MKEKPPTTHHHAWGARGRSVPIKGNDVGDYTNEKGFWNPGSQESCSCVQFPTT